MKLPLSGRPRRTGPHAPGPLSALLSGALVLSLGACLGSRAETRPGVEPPALVAPMDVTGRMQSVWEYLAEKYDADGDGHIRPEEYERVAGNFGRLDLDRDGLLSAADFPDRAAAGPAAAMGELRAMLAVLVYLQDGSRVQELTVEELESALLAADADEDGLLEPQEFQARVDARRPTLSDEGQMLDAMLMDADPWQLLLESVEHAGDGILALGEIFAFYDLQADESGIWRLDDGDPEASPGPPPGSLAPDFRLHSPTGGPPVTLSAFRGQRPVALIFGSYT